MKTLAILGSTGSIGTQALDIIRANPDKFRVSVLTCGKNVELLEQQISEFNPELVVVEEAETASALRKKMKAEVLSGREGLIEAAKFPADILLNALVGMRGLEPTYYGAHKGKTIALANKETLVAGGSLIMNRLREKETRLLPVDSEHSAIFQCLEGSKNRDCKVRRIIITASGGPFRGYNLEKLKTVTLDQALRHPRWTMGPKITIDSATLMNKGLEVIEAHYLFGIPAEKIEVLVHPQSIVHSMVEYEDSSILAQLGLPDMRVPIAYAFSYPDRPETGFESLNFLKQASNLTFEPPDLNTFSCLRLAYEALKSEESYSIALNGANEALVGLFLEGKISFVGIQESLEKLLSAHIPTKPGSLEEILEIDRLARKTVLGILS